MSTRSGRSRKRVRFSKKGRSFRSRRRRGHKGAGIGRISWMNITNNIPPTTAQIANGADVTQTPTPPTGFTDFNTGLNVITAIVEQPQSFVLGQYVFDFTRMASQTFSGTVGFPELFERVQFGRGRMSIRRVDNGSNTSVFAQYTTTGGTPALTNMIPLIGGNAPIPFLVHYLRLRPDESSTGDWLTTNNAAFMMDPRRRTRSMRPGRKLTFSFFPMVHSETYVDNTSRQYPEDPSIPGRGVTPRRITLPSHWRKQTSFPSAVVFQGNPTMTYTEGAPTTAGIGPSSFRILSKTLLIMFEVRDFTYTAQSAARVLRSPDGDLTIPGYTSGAATLPLLWRQESCRVTFSRMRLAQTYSVSPIQQVVPFGTLVDTGTPPPTTMEIFVPPRLSCLYPPKSVTAGVINTANIEPGEQIISAVGPVQMLDQPLPLLGNP